MAMGSADFQPALARIMRGPARIAESAGDTAGSLIVALPAQEMATDIKSELFQRVVKDPLPLVHNAG